MASILGRFKDIMSANINSLLDRAEDPAKMVDEYLRNMENDLQSVKAETATVMAEESKLKRDLNAAEAEAEKMEDYAKKALAAGNESDARMFLTKKKEIEGRIESLKSLVSNAENNSKKMRDMHDKLSKDMAALRSRKAEIKAKVKMAETQQKLNKVSGADSYRGNLSQFDAMEEKANRMLDEANAMVELSTNQEEQDIENAMAKYYSDTSEDSAIDDELERLKAEMNMKDADSTEVKSAEEDLDEMNNR